MRTPKTELSKANIGGGGGTPLANDKNFNLGSKTKYITPEVQKISRENKRKDDRYKRYEYLTTAQYILMNEGRKLGLEYAANYHRTCKCLLIPIDLICINLDRVRKNAFFSGLPRCSSCWSCPPCSAKIQERRRIEIAEAMAWAYANNKKCVMVTLTFPHSAADKLRELLNKQALALNKLRSGKLWSKFKSQIGFVGLIRGLEVTVGENKFHPHTHELFIVDNDACADFIKIKVREKWVKACTKAGLLDPNDEFQLLAFKKRSVHIIDRASSSDYIAKSDDIRKWGTDREIAKSSSKVGKKSGRHPFSLLEECSLGSPEAALFVEYSEAMLGRRQLFWSHGLRGLIGTIVKSDELLIRENREISDLVLTLTKEQWLQISREDARAAMLDIAESSGSVGIEAWLNKLGSS